MTYDRWYENLPYGPLTRESHDMLAVSFYDDPLGNAATRVAEARGVKKGDYLRARFAEQVQLSGTEDSAKDVLIPEVSLSTREPGESQEDYETRIRFSR